MSSNTKERLLHDLEALRHQLAEIEAYGTEREGDVPTVMTIPTLETDNIPLLGDAVPADRDEAIAAHRAAMAQLDAELKELDKKAANSQSIAANNSEHHSAIKKTTERDGTTTTHSTDKNTKLVESTAVAAVQKPVAAPLKTANLSPTHFAFEGISSTMANTKPVARADDNPFLPAHLRERLNKSKSSLLEEIARSSESLDASTALLRNFGQQGQAVQQVRTQSLDTQYQDIVDTLVAKYLPLIEADLRQRLTTALNKQVSANKKHEPSH